MNILERVVEQQEQLSKSEKKVAAAILHDPQSAIHASIANLAALAGVSEPTVNRFCRRLGTRGFPDFKLHLAQSLANGTPFLNRHVDEMDTAEAYTAKIFDSTMAALDVAKQSVDTHTINRVVDVLTQARQISFFGMGASASVAHDALNKFFRFNIPVLFHADLLMQKMHCINANESDVIVLISYTGRTKAIIELAQIASEGAGTVVAITSVNSPLSQVVDYAITLEVPEDTDIYMPMASRIAQLTVIDVLATGFTLRRGKQFRENLKRAKQTLHLTRLDSVVDR